MRKILTKIVGAVLGFTMALGVGAAIVKNNDGYKMVSADNSIDIAYDISWDSNGTSSTGSVMNGSVAPFTIKLSKGYKNTSYTHDYANGTITITGNQTVSSIDSVVITGTSGYSGLQSSGTFSISGGGTGASASGTTSVATLTAGTGPTSSWAITHNKQIRFTNIEVTYSSGASTYTVTYNANGGTGTMTDGDSPYTSGATVTVLDNTFTRYGYSFVEFNTAANGSGASYDEGDTFSISANTTLYAQWEEVDIPGTVTDTFVQSSFASADSYTEFSVSGTSGATYVGYTMTPTGDNSSYMQFNNYSSPKNRGIAASAFGGYIRRVKVTWGNANSKAFTVYVGNTPYTSSSTGASGTSKGTLDSSTTSLTITGDYKYVSLYPNGAIYPASISFIWEPFTQTLTSDVASAYNDQQITVSSNATSTVTWSVVNDGDTTASGASVNSSTGVVSVSGSGTVKVKASAPGYSDATKIVTFIDRPAGTYYDVTFDSDGGSIDPSKIVVENGGTFTFPDPGTKEHYTFDGWTSDLSDFYQPGETSPAVTGDIEYVGFWTEDPIYDITYSAGTHGSGTPYVDVDYGGTYTLPEFASLTGLSADSGYRFKDYTVGGVHKNPGDTFTLSANTGITVNFEEIPIIVTFTPAYSDKTYSASVSGDNPSSSYTFTGTYTNANQLTNGKNHTLTMNLSNPIKIKSITMSMRSNTSAGGGTLSYYIDGNDTQRVITSGKFNTANWYGSWSTSYVDVNPFNGSIYVYKQFKLVLESTESSIYCQSYSIEYEDATYEQVVEANNQTLSAMKFDYTDLGGGDYDIQNAGIRFGGFVNEDLWSELENVEGYGVIIVNHSSLGEDSIKDKYNAKKAAFAADALDNDTVDDILGAICTDLSAQKASANGSSPAYADAKQKAFMGVDESDTYRVWTLLKDIGSAFTTEFTAVAYIKIDGDILFLQETTTSMKQLATARFGTLDPEVPYYGAIQYMKVND